MITFLKRVFIITFLALPLSVYAEPQMTLTLNPDSPGPYEKVDITLNSYSFDVNATMLDWSINGKPYLSGFGLKKINVTTGALGESNIVTVKATLEDGTIIQSGISLAPQSVDVIWESTEGYTPPFYEGRTLPGEGSIVRVTALPNMTDGGVPLSPNNLAYGWYINNVYNDAASGAGKQSASVMLDILSEKTDIKVRVRSPAGAVAEKTVTIYPHDVMPILYTFDPILGINRNNALIRRFETTKTFVLSLQPYYLSTKGMGDSNKYQWLLDGLPVTPEEKTILSLQPKENSVGSKKLAISISNAKRRLQTALVSLEIIFDTRQ